MYKKDNYMRFIPGMQRCFNIYISNSAIHHINRLKMKNQMTISIATQTVIDKIKIHSW